MVSTRPKVITPNYITHLSSCEVFVFGSNLAGHHHGGAARMAHEQFGAEWGVGVGPTGQCYAFRPCKEALTLFDLMWTSLSNMLKIIR